MNPMQIWAASCALLFASTMAHADGRVRTYFIAADNVTWDYAPKGRNVLFDRAFTEEEEFWVKTGDYTIGKVFKKAIYREYTDGTFKVLKPRPPEWEHLGMLGPLIRAEVGDVIKITFRNNADFPATMHPHGVFYDKASEGALYADGTKGSDKADDAVPPGGEHVYTWLVPERAGPPPGGSSSAFWMYHSHTNEERDINAGLFGPMIVTARGKAGKDLRPVDVDREFVVAFMSTEEYESWYFKENLNKYAGKAKEFSFQRDVFGDDIAIGPHEAPYQPIMENINGYLYGNGSVLTSRQGEHVRWYVMAASGFEVHAPHWHGNTGTEDMMRTDTLQLVTMGMHVVDMVPDNVGKWLFHCHVSNHFKAGMGTFYEIVAK